MVCRIYPSCLQKQGCYKSHDRCDCDVGCGAGDCLFSDDVTAHIHIAVIFKETTKNNIYHIIQLVSTRQSPFSNFQFGRVFSGVSWDHSGRRALFSINNFGRNYMTSAAANGHGCVIADVITLKVVGDAVHAGQANGQLAVIVKSFERISCIGKRKLAQSNNRTVVNANWGSGPCGQAVDWKHPWVEGTLVVVKHCSVVCAAIARCVPWDTNSVNCVLILVFNRRRPTAFNCNA